MVKKIYFIIGCLLFSCFCRAQVSGASVAIMPVSIEGEIISEMDKRMIQSSVQDVLVGSGKWQILTRSEVDKIIDEYKFQASGIVNDSECISIGSMLSAGYVCSLSLNNEQKYSFMSISMISVHTGRIYHYSYRLLKDASPASINSCAKELARDVLAMWGEKRHVLPSDFVEVAIFGDYANQEVVEEKVEEEAIPFLLVEEKPRFQGGDANTFSKWVNQRLVYPEIAKELGVQGRVTIEFTIEKDGSVTQIRVLQNKFNRIKRAAIEGLVKEAVRVVSMSPKWTPGMQRGRAVPVTYTFPIEFWLR